MHNLGRMFPKEAPLKGACARAARWKGDTTVQRRDYAGRRKVDLKASNTIATRHLARLGRLNDPPATAYDLEAMNTWARSRTRSTPASVKGARPMMTRSWKRPCW